ncbi:MAG: ATP-dependent DNA helicase RecG, partial [Myroides sp.]
MQQNILDTPIEYLKGVGPQRAVVLKKELQIFTYKDLINFYPFKYLDRTKYYKISELNSGINAEVQLVGKIIRLKTVEQKRGSRLVAVFTDGTAEMELIWFQGHKWIKENLQLNTPYVIFGKINHFNGLFSMPHPEMETVEEHKKSLQSALQPVYPSNEKLNQKNISNRSITKMMKQVFIET